MSEIHQSPDLSEGFDPINQLLNYTTVEGASQLTFEELDHFLKSQVKNSIILGVRIGAGGLAMIALFIISKNRRTPVFLLNQVCLFLTVLHSGLYFSSIVNGYGSLGFQFTGFPQFVSDSAVNVVISTNFFQVLLTFFIEASLVFQVRTIFQNPNQKKFSYLLTGISLAVALSVVGLYLFTFIKSATITLSDRTAAYSGKPLQVQPILFASSVNFMSVLLVGKLFLAIRTRRYLGLKQFDGLHILLIMTSQSLIIPSVILIVSYAVDSWESILIPLVAQLLVVLSLPLSSMWAASANNAQAPTSYGGPQSFSTSFKTPTGADSTFYSSTFRSLEKDGASKNGDFDFENSTVPVETLATPSTAIDEEAKKYWIAANASDDVEEEDDGILRKTVHKFTSD